MKPAVLLLALAYTGLIDDVAIFSRALTDAEVKTIFTLKHGIAELHR